MNIRHDLGRHRIIRAGVIKKIEDSGKNIEASVEGTGGGGSTLPGSAHNHLNKPLLDDLSVTAQTKLLVGGVPTATHMHEEAW